MGMWVEPERPDEALSPFLKRLGEQPSRLLGSSACTRVDRDARHSGRAVTAWFGEALDLKTVPRRFSVVSGKSICVEPHRHRMDGTGAHHHRVGRPGIERCAIGGGYLNIRRGRQAGARPFGAEGIDFGGDDGAFRAGQFSIVAV